MTEIDRRRQILEGALRVFSKHGFHKASIKMIAKEAGIKSSALIYHYFADKKAVLEAIIREITPVGDLPILNPDLQAQLLNMPPEMLLPQIMRAVLASQDSPEMMNLAVIFISEASRMPDVADAVLNIQRQVLGFLVRYMQHQIDAGYFRRHDPEISARMVIGLVMVNVFGTNLFKGLAGGFSSREAYIEQVIEIFLDGIRSDG